MREESEVGRVESGVRRLESRVETGKVLSQLKWLLMLMYRSLFYVFAFMASSRSAASPFGHVNEVQFPRSTSLFR